MSRLAFFRRQKRAQPALNLLDFGDQNGAFRCSRVQRKRQSRPCLSTGHDYSPKTLPSQLTFPINPSAADPGYRELHPISKS